MFDLSRLEKWQRLPFFHTRLPEITQRLEGTDFLPPAGSVFAALERCQPQDTKVVILGQDPYHTADKADGMAFSIPQDFGGRLDSLGNIFKELHDDLGVKRTRTELGDWADQGVLLLNTALTVPPGMPKAHAKLGWSDLVAEVLTELSNKPRAALLWGGPAQNYSQHLRGDHLVLTAAHPSPLSARRGFFGSRPFSTVNRWLKERGETPIKWADP